MAKVIIGEQLLAEWGLDKAQFDKGLWGNLIGNFKIYNSLVGVYTKTTSQLQYQTDPITGQYVPTMTTDPVTGLPVQATTSIVVPDTERTINEIILLYLSSAYANIPQLRMFRFKYLSDHCKAYMRQAVLKAIQFGLTNRNILQKINDVSIKGSNIDITVTPQQTLTQLSWWGDRARDDIMNSGIFDYDIVKDTNAVISLSRSGNYIIHGKKVLEEDITDYD